MTDRWQHQPEEVKHALEPARALFWSPRSGKTRAVVSGMKRQLCERGVDRFLVIAPQFVCRTVWVDEIEQTLGIQTMNVSEGRIEQRRAWLREARTIHEPLAVLVNWDTLARLLPEILAWGPEVVIADEAHYAKSAGAARSRALHRLGARAKFRRILTGTPTPKNYIDLYSQYKFLDPTIFGTNKNKFLERYVQPDPWGRPKYYMNLPELRSKMLSVASVFDRRIAWKDQPPQEIRRRVQLPVYAKELYGRLVRDTVAEWEGKEIDATHKLARIGKLQQLTAGFVRTDEGTVEWIHSAKVDAVVEELRDILEAGEKVIVFYHYAEEGKKIEDAIRKEYGPVVGRIGGGTPILLRETLQRKFLDEKGDVSVMVMQDSLGIGIKLTANYLIRTSYPLDYAAYDQSNERMYRDPDQNRTWISLEVPNSIDQFARRICTKKEQASRALTTEGFEQAAFGKVNLELAA